MSYGRAIRRAAMIGAMAFLSMGCGSDDSDGGSSLTLAFIPKTSDNLVFTLGNEGAQAAAADLTAASGTKVTVEYLASPELTLEAELGHIEEAMEMGVDGMLISCIDEGVTPAINEAVEKGIPVITYDSDCPDSNRLAFYSMSSEETGAVGADLLAAALGEGSHTIGVLQGRAGADNLERRYNGFKDRLDAEYPDLEIVDLVNCQETAESCGSAIEDELLENNPDLGGLFVVGLWGTQSGCSCDDSGLDCTCEDDQMAKWKAASDAGLKTVSFDTLPFQLILLEQGYISGLIGQKMFGWGYDTASIMFDHLKFGREVSGFLDSGFDLVCQNNVDDMLSKWKALDFRTVVSPECDLIE